MEVKITVAGVHFEHETVTVRYGFFPVEDCTARTVTLRTAKNGGIEVSPKAARREGTSIVDMFYNLGPMDGEDWKDAKEKYSEAFLYRLLAAAQAYLGRHALMPVRPAPLVGAVPDRMPE